MSAEELCKTLHHVSDSILKLVVEQKETIDSFQKEKICLNASLIASEFQLKQIKKTIEYYEKKIENDALEKDIEKKLHDNLKRKFDEVSEENKQNVIMNLEIADELKGMVKFFRENSIEKSQNLEEREKIQKNIGEEILNPAEPTSSNQKTLAS